MATDLLSPSVEKPSLTERIASIDVFRGLTMLVMLFVNDIGDADLGNIQNAPWWLHHARLEDDGMTMPDVIFPAFLFIVGLAIPAALAKRIAHGDSWLKLAWHIVSRSLALIFIGVCMANACHSTPLDEAAMGMTGAMWRLLFFLSAIVLWNRYPSGNGMKRWLFVSLRGSDRKDTSSMQAHAKPMEIVSGQVVIPRWPQVLRLLAVAMLVYLLVIFRASENGEAIWFRPRWWGIVGLIGWSYLIAAFIWVACRDCGAALMAAMALLLTLDCGARSGALDWLSPYINGYQPGLESLGGLSAIVVAGTVVASLFRPNSTVTTSIDSDTAICPCPAVSAAERPVGDARLEKSRIAWLLTFAGGLALAGYLLWPQWGIHKLSCSPTWVLFSTSIACIIYAFLYWRIDVKKITDGTSLIELAGTNTLLMYMLPHIFYALLALLGIDFLQTHLNDGVSGVLRSAVLAVFFVAVTALLTRCRVRLQL